MTKMKKRAFPLIALALTLALVTTLSTVPALAAGNMTPDYEVKFLLDSEQALNSRHELTAEVRGWFGMTAAYEPIAILYADTDGQAFNQAGWVNRIRHKDKANEFELTYKKRYPVNGITSTDITAALNLANSNGFDSNENDYEAQIDWSYDSMTLSLSNDKTYSNSGYAYANEQLPNEQNAIAMLADKLPGKEKNWSGNNWGSSLINNSRVYGPITYKKYEGTFNSKKTVIEIWPILTDDGNGTEYIVEISFKANTYAQASSLRASLLSFLDTQEIALHENGLKTQTILDRY
jgi:hypothetical protein